MPGLDPGIIHGASQRRGLAPSRNDGRVEPGHDGCLTRLGHLSAATGRRSTSALASGRSAFLSPENRQAQTATIASTAAPPNSTEPTAPNQAAVMPDSNMPIWPEVETDRLCSAST